MPSFIKSDRVSFSYPDRRVLTDISFTVNAGEIAGLIGENGAGKSTLLSLLAGGKPDAGTFAVPDRLGFITQETTLAFDSPVGALIDEAVAEIRQLETEIEELSAAMSTRDVTEEFDRALSRAEQSQLWSLDSRIEQVRAGLGLSDIDPATPIHQLSGGQRRRYALAALLLRPVDAMLLDEPTNHLDDAAVDFLMAELASFPGPIIAASHDRWFLDHCATDIIDLDPALGAEGGYGEDSRQGALFHGSFSEYLAWRAAARTRWEHDYSIQEQNRSELEGKLGISEGDIFHSTEAKSETRVSQKFFADRAAKTVGNRLKATRNRLEELERFEIPPPPPKLSFTGALSVAFKPRPEALLRLDSVAVTGRLRTVKLEMFAGDTRLVIGPNGAGKSTLLAIAAGLLSPDSGERVLAEGVRIGYLTQDSEWESLEATPRELCPELVELGLLDEDRMHKPLRELSLGQQRRVAIGMVLVDPPEVLLLDEPTNHIALALAEDLEHALVNYPGVCLIASHDRWLRNRWPAGIVEISPLSADNEIS
ncbi:ABC-F family ATP-binding cassette domain-containing protein [Corynebacterium sp. H127]|uniref:ABC-F family ATP-binding cassette domain-containing protein n=1 Tax=Corynebacterium sp. H127 TaxID=3133418 RepID=UPI0030B5FAE5